jgi:hypothetical protein
LKEEAFLKKPKGASVLAQKRDSSQAEVKKKKIIA